MALRIERNTTWDQLPGLLETADPEGKRLLPLVGGGDPSRAASQVLLDLLIERSATDLAFVNPPAARAAAARILIESRLGVGIPELCLYLRDHWLYDGETEEIGALVEELAAQAMAPFRGLEAIELVGAVEQQLFGRVSDPGSVLKAAELALIRVVCWAARDNIALLPPPGLESPEDLAHEIAELGI